MKNLALAVLLATSFAAHAAPTLTPIGNVDILGNTYGVSLLSDLTFNSQTFAALNPSITFTTDSDAKAAAQALLDTFGSSFDWNPTCVDCTIKGVQVVYGTNSTSYFDWYVREGSENVFQSGGSLLVGNNFSYAQFSAPIPEPETYAMMMAGLGLLGFIAKRKKTD